MATSIADTAMLHGRRQQRRPATTALATATSSSSRRQAKLAVVAVLYYALVLSKNRLARSPLMLRAWRYLARVLLTSLFRGSTLVFELCRKTLAPAASRLGLVGPAAPQLGCTASSPSTPNTANAASRPRAARLSSSTAAELLCNRGFSFSASSWLLFYHFGVAECLVDTFGVEALRINGGKFGGASCGSLMAALLVCELDLGRYQHQRQRPDQRPDQHQYQHQHQHQHTSPYPTHLAPPDTPRLTRHTSPPVAFRSFAFSMIDFAVGRFGGPAAAMTHIVEGGLRELLPMDISPSVGRLFVNVTSGQWLGWGVHCCAFLRRRSTSCHS